MDNVRENVLLKPWRFAKFADISRSQVYKLIQQGDIPAVQIGRSLRIPASALDDLVKKAKAASLRLLRSKWAVTTD